MSWLKEKSSKVLGKYLNQPIHITLNEFRFIAVGSIGAAWYMLFDIWFYLKKIGAAEDTTFITGVIGLAVTMLGTIFKATDHIRDKISKDE